MWHGWDLSVRPRKVSPLRGRPKARWLFFDRHPALGYRWSLIPAFAGQAFSDLPSPAEASSQTANHAKGFAQALERCTIDQSVKLSNSRHYAACRCVEIEAARNHDSQ
jgi:hypothetical protein